MAVLGMFIVAETISELSDISTATIPEFLKSKMVSQLLRKFSIVSRQSDGRSLPVF